MANYRFKDLSPETQDAIRAKLKAKWTVKRKKAASQRMTRRNKENAELLRRLRTKVIKEGE